MGRKRSHDEYITLVAAINPNLDVIERYINNYTPILHRCKLDGYQWSIRPYSVLGGQGCPMCAGNAKRTHEQYIKDLANIALDIEPVEEYINTDTPILHKCRVCEHIWPIKPNHTLNGHGCPMCKFKINADSKRKSQTQYIQELFYVNPNIEVIGEYVNYITPLLHRCKKCSNEWEAKPIHTMRGHGCTVCNESHGERGVSQWLTNNNVEYIPQHRFDDCRDKQPLPFDFYLPKLNIAIEYQGHQHYESIDFFGGQVYLEYVQSHDKIKSDYCAKNNIQLICVPYWEDINQYLNNFLLI